MKKDKEKFMNSIVRRVLETQEAEAKAGEWKLVLKPIEMNSGAKFNGKVVMTSNFAHQMGGQMLASLLAVKALKKIHAEVDEVEGTDYLRVFETVKGDVVENKFWVIDGGEYVTFLMPEDY